MFPFTTEVNLLHALGLFISLVMTAICMYFMTKE